MGWQDLWSMEESRISFLIRSTYDVHPSPHNLNLWVGEDPSCPLYSSPATLRHILTGCKMTLETKVGLLGTMTAMSGFSIGRQV